MTLSVFDAARESSRSQLALVMPEEKLTWADAARRAQAVVAWIQRENLVGEPLGLEAHPHATSVISLYALLATGSPAVLLHPRWTGPERARALEAAQARRVVPLDLDEDAAPLPWRASPIDPERTLAIVHTSGSTGGPKAAALSRRAFLAAAAASQQRLGWRPDDRWLLSLPFAHVGGLSVIVRCLLARKPVVLPGSGVACAEEAFEQAVDDLGVSLASLVPTQLTRSLRRRWTPPATLRATLIGGAPAPPSLVEAAITRGWPVLTTYGMTETCSQVATQVAPSASTGCGPVLPGSQLRIRQGAIELRGPSLFTGYLPSSRPPTTSDGWFSTGDLGRLDDYGNLHVLGRLDDVIISGGEKVFPLEVEAELLACQGVAEVCVFQRTDPEWGASVCAAVVAEAGADLAAAFRHLRSRLASHKIPKQVAQVTQLPRNPSGKVDRRALAAQPLLFTRFQGP